MTTKTSGGYSRVSQASGARGRSHSAPAAISTGPPKCRLTAAAVSLRSALGCTGGPSAKGMPATQCGGASGYSASTASAGHVHEHEGRAQLRIAHGVEQPRDRHEARSRPPRSGSRRSTCALSSSQSRSCTKRRTEGSMSMCSERSSAIQSRACASATRVEPSNGIRSSCQTAITAGEDQHLDRQRIARVSGLRCRAPPVTRHGDAPGPRERTLARARGARRRPPASASRATSAPASESTR